MPATAAIDNETLDHLLSVVEDTPMVGAPVRFAKAGFLLSQADESPCTGDSPPIRRAGPAAVAGPAAR